MAALVPNPGSKGRRRAATYHSNNPLISRALAAEGETWSTSPWVGRRAAAGLQAGPERPGLDALHLYWGRKGRFSGHKNEEKCIAGGCDPRVARVDPRGATQECERARSPRNGGRRSAGASAVGAPCAGALIQKRARCPAVPGRDAAAAVGDRGPRCADAL